MSKLDPEVKRTIFQAIWAALECFLRSHEWELRTERRGTREPVHSYMQCKLCKKRRAVSVR